MRHDAVWLTFSVSDTGVGIPADRQQSIFEAFTQVDGSTSRNYGGTGLGLSISTKLVQMMGGQLQLESELGKGGRFALPFHSAVSMPEPTVGRLRILVAEDNVVNQLVVVGTLGKAGHEAVVADNGRAALELFKRSHFDVVLMDVQMPELDGYQATAHIRKLERGTNRHLPIIAMTAHAMKGDHEHCRKMGMDGYVSKPTNSNLLFQAIDEVMDLPMPKQRALPFR